MSYYRFYPDVKLVKGTIHSNIYFLGGKELINLNTKESEILEYLENESVESACQRFLAQEVKKILEFLLSKGLGNLYPDKVYAESYIPNMPFELKGYLEPPMIINEMVIEVGYDDRYGIFEKDKLIVFQGCNSCIPSVKLNTNVESELEAVKKCLKEISQIKIEKLTLHCGKLNDYIEYVKDIYHIFNVNNPGGCLEIVTYHDVYSCAVIEFLEKVNPSFIICSTDKALLEKNAFFDDLMELQKRALVGVNLVLLHEDSTCFEDIKKKTIEIGIPLCTTEIIRSVSDKIISLPTSKDRLENVGIESYFFRTKSNGCLYGKIMIDCNGNIRPCLYNSNILGNVLDGFISIFEKELHEKYWTRSKNKIEICKKCENRYACVDCNTIEEFFDQQSEYKNIICDYDVDAGIWKEGHS